MPTPHSPLASSEVEQASTRVQMALTYLDAFLRAGEKERPVLERKMRAAYFKIGTTDTQEAA